MCNKITTGNLIKQKTQILFQKFYIDFNNLLKTEKLKPLKK